MDDIDIANERNDEHNARSIHAAIGKYRGISAVVCESCGEPIPAKRRQLLPGVRVCVDCQRAHELRKRIRR